MQHPVIDNVKLLLITLVVFGHVIEPMKDYSSSIHAAYRFIYAFHVPALVFLVGLTSKAHFSFRQGIGILSVLALFQTVYVGLYADESFDYWTKPYWLLWFLLSLFFWRISLPFITRLPAPVLCAVLVSLACGCIPWVDNDFSLSRTLVFLPFFVLGYFHGNSLLSWLQTRQTVIKIIIGLLCCMIVVLTADTILDERWYYGRYPYQQFQVTLTEAVYLRAYCLSAGMAGIIALLLFIPNRSFDWTVRGRRILAVYVLHGLILIPLQSTFIEIARESPVIALLSAIILALLFVWVFSYHKIHALIYFLYRPSSK